MKKQNRSKKALWITLSSVTAVLLAAVITVICMVQAGRLSLLSTEGMQFAPNSDISDTEVSEDGQTVVYKGETYRYNENMTAILCMGIDRKYAATELPSGAGHSGQADAIFLYAMDTKTGASTILPIPRDTMVDIDLYSQSGKYVSSSKKQICLSFAYGDGKHTSCENTVKSVSRLLYGIPINSYVAIDLDAIPVLVDKVGGVPVTPLADGTYGGKAYRAGKEVVLSGTDATAFLTERELTLEGSLERMSRQKIFAQSFFHQALSKTKKDIQIPIALYRAITPYMTTDITLSEVSFFTSRVLSGSFGGSLQFSSVQGTVKEGATKLAEYHADSESVYRTVLEIFYQKQS